MSRVVTFGEIMARVAMPGFARFRQAMPGAVNLTFAGAEASIAASLACLGVDAAFVTALPDHAVADACIDELRGLGVETRYILRTSAGRMGVFYLEHGVNQRGGNVIYDREGASVAVTPADAYDWNAAFAGCEWFVISGITAAISRNGADVALHAVREAARRGIKVVCDINFRTKLWRWDPPAEAQELARRTLGEILPYVTLFVGGVSDAALVLGIGPDDDLKSLARRLCTRFPGLGHAAFTLREGSTSLVQVFGGALYDVAAEELHASPRHSISQVVDRLGAGDAFTAGLVVALMEGRPGAEAVAFAAAAGCLAHSTEGDYHRGSREEIEALMVGDGGGRVSR
jgi:2-dehydro-3-deoxygluconokinase